MPELMAEIVWELERIGPSQRRGERIVLERGRDELTIGRAADSDVRLFSASASRQHAVARRGEDRRWWLFPLDGKSVLADGVPTSEPTELCEGLVLAFGADRFRCQSPTQGVPAPGPSPSSRRVGLLWLAGGLLVLLIGLVAAVVLRASA